MPATVRAPRRVEVSYCQRRHSIRWPSRSHRRAFQPQQLLLHVQAAAVAVEAAVAADDAVTGHNDGDRVLAERCPHGPRCPGLADRPAMNDPETRKQTGEMRKQMDNMMRAQP